ncbi:tetratricopeptide repeat protein [Vibrio intestinalis]|uniref:tetratricopeptide repeat protein n=1 Tax=Vibrio intestinalis TaxID=2933291 RepID=UPI0021A94786|nr:J domain-containing protein [Vibrio intestinalis]
MLKAAMLMLALFSASSWAMTPAEFEQLLHQAELNNPRAQYQVAKAYQLGDGVSASSSEALYWLEQAANHRYKQAQNELVAYYQQPETQNMSKAMFWLTKLAINGDDQAQFELGQLYEDQGKQLSATSQAKIWYQLAAEHNSQAEEAYSRVLEAEFNAQRAKQVAAINEMDEQLNHTASSPISKTNRNSAPLFTPLSYALLTLVALLVTAVAWLWRSSKSSIQQLSSDANVHSSKSEQLKQQIKQQESTLKQQKRQMEAMYNQLKKQQLELKNNHQTPVAKPASATSFSLACALFGYDSQKLPDEKQIKVRYKQLCKIYHPDLKGSDEEMKRLNSALKLILKNVNK